jgi:predicted nucleic acid-binding protein
MLLAECRNAILTTVRRGKLSVERAQQLERDFEGMQIETLPSRMFLSNAFAIAPEIGHPIYDCIYLAAAIAADRMLVTADEKFAMKVTGPVIGYGRVKLLRTFAAGT